jgi:hypothetical protein
VICRTKRSIAHSAKEKLRDLFYRLSPQTRYMWFGYMKTHISEQELDYFTSVNPPDMYAYIAAMGRRKKKGEGRVPLLPGIDEERAHDGRRTG